MSGRRISVVGAVAAIAVVVIAALTAAMRSSSIDERGEHDAVAVDLASREVEIRTWQLALAADDASAIANGQLAGLYLQRARESGDDSNYLEAERYARQSVGLRMSHNGAALATLASALVAQHRFHEADSILVRLVHLEPDVPQYHAMLGEIRIELGDYRGAGESFSRVLAHGSHLSIAPRLARWMEMRGDTASARRLLRNALAEAKGRHGMPREQLAWFHFTFGDLELRSGRLRAARTSFREGLAIAPNDHRLLGGMSRLEASRRRYRKAIEHGERAMAIRLDERTLRTIGESWAAIGNDERAGEYFRAAEIALAASGTPAVRQ